MTPIEFNGFKCNLVFTKYPNGTPRINLIDTEDGMPVATATTVTESILPQGYVFIKSYSENKGMIEALEEAKVVKSLGIVDEQLIICKLLKHNNNAPQT